MLNQTFQEKWRHALEKLSDTQAIPYTQVSMTTYSADVSGVASALYELGGMTVIHDASGCNSTYATHDEPRWVTMPSAVYISALTEMDAVLGNEERLIDDILNAAKDINPRFIAIAGTPVPMMTGSDLAGIARIVEMRSTIPSFALATHSMRPYSIGVAQSWLEIARRFCPTDVLSPQWDKKEPLRINILGATPLDLSIVGALEDLKRVARDAGFSIHAVWAMGDTLETLSHSNEAHVNWVVASCGMPLAQAFESCWNQPFVAGLPIGVALRERWQAAIVHAAQSRRSVTLASLLAPFEEENAMPNTLIVGDPLTAASLSVALKNSKGSSPLVVTPLPALGAQVGAMQCECSEDQILSAMSLTDTVIADPLYEMLAHRAGVKNFLNWPHEAASGRMYHHLMPILTNDDKLNQWLNTLSD